MNIEFDAPILGWRTLKDIYREYLARTPSEEGTSAAEAISRAEKRATLERVVAEVGASHGRLAPEKHGEMLASVEEDIEQAKRMRAIVAHIMTRDAAEGLWFAIGRADGIGKHQLIHPRHWNFLLMNIEKGAVGRDSLRFQDLRCAFTRDVPADHPVHAVLRIAQKDNVPVASADNIDAREHVSPPTVPSLTAHINRHDGPGRPSTFHFIDKEFERRIRHNAVEPSLSKQAQALSAWFKTAYPQLKPYQPKTIANRLRAQYRAAITPRNGTKL
jgi:hypothetical protein